MGYDISSDDVYAGRSTDSEDAAGVVGLLQLPLRAVVLGSASFGPVAQRRHLRLNAGSDQCFFYAAL